MDLLWTSFLNSDWHDWRGSGEREDRLDKPGWVGRFLAHWGLTDPGVPGPEALAELKRVRELLHRMAQGLARGEALVDEDLAALNALMAPGPVVRQVTPADAGYRLDLLPAGSGWPQTVAEIAASFARTLAEGEGARVRICDNPDCLWVFYDDTRNRTKRFCDDKLCGNLMKVRRFRARKRATAERE